MRQEDSNEHTEINVVIPVYQNVDSLIELHDRLSKILIHLNRSWQIIFVDDASPDQSLSVLEKLVNKDPNITVITLEENVGQHRAVLTGLWYCDDRCKYVVVMDADLQDPPEAIPGMILALENGFDAVFAGRRGRYESSIRLLTSRFFKYIHHIMNKVPKDAGMFMVMSQNMVDNLNSLFSSWPSVISMIGWTGLPTTSIPVERSKRMQGKSAYNEWNRLKTAFSALIGGICWRCFSKTVRNRKRQLRGQVFKVFGRQQLRKTAGNIR